MRYGSVCSGIEAASVAWEPLGWQPEFYSEIEAFPCAVLKHHWPHVPNLGDMTKFKEWKRDRPIDLLVGGTPCQSFSIAGLRAGLDDPRGNLMLTYCAIIERERPRWLVWENVPGVLSSNEGRDFGTFLAALGELGYGVAYRVLDAQYFGVAQRRRRVFVVGYLGEWQRAAAVLFERESMRGDPKPSRKTPEDVAGTLDAGFDRRRGSGMNPNQLAAVASPITTRTAASDRGDGCDNLVLTNAEGSDGATLTRANIGKTLNNQTPLVVHGTQDPCISDKAFTLGRNRGQENVVSISLRGRNGGVTAEAGRNISPALRASSGGGDKQYVLTNIVRRLTPIECERLQGFPDNHTQIPWRGRDATQGPDGPRYKAIGNSMAVPVMRWIGNRIQQVDEIK